MLGLALLAGCAIPTTGIVPRGEGMYTVRRQGEGAWVTPDTLKVAAIQEADAYCKQDKKGVKVIHTKEIPAGALGRWPESEFYSDVISTRSSVRANSHSAGFPHTRTDGTVLICNRAQASR